MTVDDRTNSIIVAGSINDLQTVGSIINRLEAAEVQQRYTDVYKLRNAAAADVATSLQTLITNMLTVYSGANLLSAYQSLQRNVVIVAEPVSNTILVSATPQYFADIKRIIDRIDAQPPQVVIQVMIADVQLNNAEEFGVEVGLQSPILFSRSVLPTSTTTTGSTGEGASSTTSGAAANPGFNFNTTAPLSNNVLTSQSTVGFQGIGNLGVGRSSSSGFGGFVFSAASDAFSLLIRALKAQGRVDILSRPQIQVADNQTGFVQVGQNYPYLGASTLTATGAAQQSLSYQQIGVTMRVTPRVNPDGKVLMRVEPQVASVAPNPVSLGNGVTQPIFNVETVQTTVLASDGETVVLGGLISKQDTRTENAIPYLKDIPYLGALFRYRSHAIARREVLIIMTPHIVRTEYDSARVLAEEARRMAWCVPDVAKIHGHGLEVIGPAMAGSNPIPVAGTVPGAIPQGMLPAGFNPGFTPPPFVPGPGYYQPPAVDPVPQPRCRRRASPSPLGTAVPGVPGAHARSATPADPVRLDPVRSRSLGRGFLPTPQPLQAPQPLPGPARLDPVRSRSPRRIPAGGWGDEFGAAGGRPGRGQSPVRPRRWWRRSRRRDGRPRCRQPRRWRRRRYSPLPCTYRRG